MIKINKNHINFLKEYEKLCKKYNMGLCGCGCCESPYLVDYNDEKCSYVEYLENININDEGEVTINPYHTFDERLEDFIIRVEKEGRIKYD